MLNQTFQKFQTLLGFNQIAIGPLKTPLTIEFYEKWIAKDFQAQMGYLKDHLPTKKNPRLLNQNLNSVITITQPYFPAPQPTEIKIPARIATYAQNNDYHFWLKEKLNILIIELKKEFPQHEFLPYVDSGPILERNWAYENGMGWFGKNTCLIHPKFGSLFFIAEILTTLNIDAGLPTSDAESNLSEPTTSSSASVALETKQTDHPIAPLPDFCGKCRKCIEICPTNALIEPHVLQAEKCISYLTIESKTTPPLELRPKMNDWFFGCDLCQTTCPWNEKVFRANNLSELPATSTQIFLQPNPELSEFFKTILNSSNKQIAKMFTGSALFRAGGNGLKRNALVVIANRRMTDLKEDVQKLTTHPKLAELADWCLQQLNS